MRMTMPLLAAVAALSSLAADPPPAPSPAPPVQPAALEAWREARFGMFIHWGPVSLTGHEIGWSRGAQTPIEVYDALYKKFNPTNYNADEWAATAKAAGMKYVVLTTKHHDGFCLFDTKQTDYNVMNSAFGRDVTKELAQACRHAGLKFGTYHSVCDWHHPDFPRTSPGGKVRRTEYNLDRYNDYLKKQVTELITQYGPLWTMWFDVPQEFDRARGEDLIRLCRGLQPDIVVNNRSGAPGDYDTPEQRVGKYQDDRPWETCMTICHQWSWMPDDKMKTLEECLQTLVRCVGGDGNLLFNVGPMPDGRIEPRQVERLKEMGAWLEKFGESIYATRGGPYMPGPALASTRRGNVVYLHVLRWPADGGDLVLPALGAKIVSARILGGGAAQAEPAGGELHVRVAAADRKPIDTVIRLELDGPAMALKPIPTGSGPAAKASNVYQKSSHFGADMAVDGDAGTRWATDAGLKKAWLEVDYGKPAVFRGVRIREAAYAGRIRKFEVKCVDGEPAKVLCAGKTVGEKFSRDFEPFTGRKFRFEVLDAADGPTIEEFEMVRAK